LVLERVHKEHDVSQFVVTHEWHEIEMGQTFFVVKPRVFMANDEFCGSALYALKLLDVLD
jgi:hypothetical protein